ncbi:MAG: helix-turn-helix domain-containing protein, partial [Lachnospiraceae bacterium]|nr:helix-turn-helix domain-containing protein [Lachnospiraceae bacterium]
MRDYSFGNFLHELRMRRGLSQFQLGMLVGVSDKAVSKWENGLAKPQSRILYKLSEILGITVDELLACKYRSADNKNIKGVFAMKKELWKKADEVLEGLYGNMPPMEVVNRYFSEYEELKNSDQIIYFEFLSRLAEQAKRSGEHMHINGGIGASFVAFIMGTSELNPLSPHYYCPDCRKIKFENGLLCGWDLPVQKCSCGREMIRDGHLLPFETLRHMISRTARYDILVSENLYQTAEKIIFTFFQGNKIVILTKEEPGIRTYVILNTEFPDLADGQEVSFRENYDRLKKYPAITLIRNEELDVWGKLEKEAGIMFENVPFTDKKVFDAFFNGDT